MINRLRTIFIPPTKLSVAHRAVLIAVLAVFGWYGSGLYANLTRVASNANPLQLVSALSTTSLKETNGRTNILVAGYSADDAGHAGATLTDSIMIVSIKQSDNSATVISIPRDLYVNIDGYGYSKINAAYQYGESSNFSEAGYATGGMGLLEKTVQQATGISLNYNALINYAAFKDTVDAVGGVSVTIQNSEGINDPNTGIKLPAGINNLDGQTALNLARARGEGYGSYGFADGDFSRTQYQQQILLALKQKISSSSVSLNPLKIAKLASAIGNNVKTDLNLGEIKTLYTATKSVNENSIATITLNDIDGTSLLSNYTTSSGQSALIPTDGIDDFSGITATLASKLQ